MKRILASTFCVAILALPALAADVTPPIDKRFADKNVDEVPDFRRHVSPLMARLGCNGRACHGSFQGRGGFQLSLFGYDFKMDHEALTTGDDPRVNVEKPDESLFLQKPTQIEPHEGGTRYEQGSWQHRVFRQWVAGGAHPASENVDLVRLDVTPKEIVFSENGQTVQMRVVAVWSDGSREDVTPLTRIESKDSQVAEVDAGAVVTSDSPGDTHLVVSYDRDVVPIPVMRPFTDLAGSKYPKVKPPTEIDRLVVEKLRKLGIVPSEVCTDAEFLRRVSLDLTGTLPAPEEVKRFLADDAPDKRARKVDELLESPAYAAWWTTRLCDITGNNADALINITPVRGSEAQQWYDWIYKRVEGNVSYADIAEGIVMAVSRKPDQSYYDYCKEMSELYHAGSEKSYADLDYMTHYWSRRTFQRPEDRAIGFAYTFLGIRIQCAQCHKHPFDQWSKEDFAGFQNFFGQVSARANRRDPEYRKMLEDLGLDKLRGGEQRRAISKLLEEGKVVPFQEVAVQEPRNRRRRNRNRNNDGRTAKILGGEVVKFADHEDVRRPLMDWLKSPENPLFAKAFVNRAWASYFNVGIVDPPDDLSLANAPSNGPLLDYLAQGFIEHDFDMKWLHREIVLSDTYQRSWRPNETNRDDQRNFSHAIPRRLPAEVAYDAIQQATSSDKEIAEMRASLEDRAINIPGSGRRRRNRNSDVSYALTVFGRSTRESNCDCDRSSEPSLLQTVFLQNDQAVYRMISRPRGGWISQVADDLGISRRRRAAGDDNRVVRMRRAVQRLRRQIARLKKQGDEERLEAAQKRFKRARQRLAQLQKNPPRAEPQQRQPDGNKLEPDQAEQIVNEAYFRTLSRKPTQQELERSREYLLAANDTLSGVEDLLWTLLNTKEFIVNH